MTWGAIGSAAVGVVGGALASGGSGGGSSQTASKEPWEAAAPWLKDILSQGQDLQGYYQQNPFNQLQQTGMQNTVTDLDNLRSNVAPTLTAFSNRLMGENYQRAPRRGDLGATQVPGMPSMQAPVAPTPGLMQMQGQAPISQQFAPAAGNQYGLIDFAKLNPYSPGNTLNPPAPPPAAAGPAYPDMPSWADGQQPPWTPGFPSYDQNGLGWIMDTTGGNFQWKPAPPAGA